MIFFLVDKCRSKEGLRKVCAITPRRSTQKVLEKDGETSRTPVSLSLSLSLPLSPLSLSLSLSHIPSLIEMEVCT